MTPRERPILFSAPMVRALLDGRKTQTRRIVKPQADSIEPHDGYPGEWSPWKDGERQASILCPYGVSGDRLWVRETTIIAPKRWNDGYGATHVDAEGDKRIVQYLATSPSRDAAKAYNLKATPTIHMPRWASRITLELTDVRVHRLLDITEDDARAEGAENARAFVTLWDSINGKGSWDASPWVWALTFRLAQ